MARTPSQLDIQATLLATTLEYLSMQGLDAAAIKRLFSPEMIDGWFEIKARATQSTESEPA